MSMKKPFVIISGSSHPRFAEALATELGVGLGQVDIATFSDSETHVTVHADVHGKEVFIVQSGYAPTNDRLVELLLLCEAVWHKKPKRITVVLPFMPYRRQEKQTHTGEALAFDVVARVLRAVGVKRILTIDLHKHRSRQFFKAQGMSCTELRAFSLFSDYFSTQMDTNQTVVVAPDKGSVPESERYARALNIPLVKFFKRRTQRDTVVVDGFEGSVDGKHVLIIDDEINTGGTLIGVVRMLKEHGARDIIFACTHAVLSGAAVERLSSSSLKRVIVSDTIPQRSSLPIQTTLSVVPLFAERIRRWTQ